MSNPVAQLHQESVRPVFWFDLPEELRLAGTVDEKIGFVKLTGREEAEAAQDANGDSVALAFSLTKKAFWGVDGKRFNRGVGEDEQVWNALDPAARQLCLAAYSHLHTPGENVTKKFLATLTQAISG